ncbi:TadE/TadG family type IV pilus assembly protein [Nocardioides sp. LHG3406-4]|uniref:TadE/TadG family type IV pilus assembly protein n=1 Tax=Nocardioides sp. LHG3406-4 TaxID=2804575 RepID=UPI003CF6FF09
MTRRRRDERGSGLVEFVWLGIILIVPLLWIVLSVFEVQRGAFAVSAAARAAGRAYALAPNDQEGRARAQAVADLTLKDQGSPGMVAKVVSSCDPGPPCHQGTSVVTVTVTSGVDLPLLPEIIGGDRPSFALSATHRVPIGQYVQSGTASGEEDQDGEPKPTDEPDETP